jgi:hypothetical protein
MDRSSRSMADTAICILVSQLAQHVLFCLREVGTLVMAYNAFDMHEAVLGGVEIGTS